MLNRRLTLGLSPGRVTHLPPLFKARTGIERRAVSQGMVAEGLAFIDRLLSPEGQRILARHGFTAPGQPREQP